MGKQWLDIWKKMSDPDNAIVISDNSDSDGDDSPLVSDAQSKPAEAESAPPEGGLTEYISVSSPSWQCAIDLAWKWFQFDVQNIIEKWKAVANYTFQDTKATALFNSLPTYLVLLPITREGIWTFVQQLRNLNCKDTVEEADYVMFLFLFGLVIRNPKLVRHVILSYPSVKQASINFLNLAFSLALQHDCSLGLLRTLGECGIPFYGPYNFQKPSAKGEELFYSITQLQHRMLNLPGLLSPEVGRAIAIRGMTVEDINICVKTLYLILDEPTPIYRQETVVFFLSQAVEGRQHRERMQNVFLMQLSEMLDREDRDGSPSLPELLASSPSTFVTETKRLLRDEDTETLCRQILKTLAEHLQDVCRLPPRYSLTQHGLLQENHVRWFPSHWMQIYLMLTRCNGGSQEAAKVFGDWALLQVIFSYVEVRPQENFPQQQQPQPDLHGSDLEWEPSDYFSPEEESSELESDSEIYDSDYQEG